MRPSARRRALAALCLGLAAPRWALAQASGTIAVVYPEVGEPFRSVFARIVEGIDERARERVTKLVIDAHSNSAELAEELRRRDARVVIALGRQGWTLVKPLEPSLAVIVGCVVSVPEGQARGATIYTLAPDPALLFARLRELVPAARRVIVVYDPRQNDWLLRLAREAAKAQGLELMAQEASDLPAALRVYQAALARADARRDTLWLPQDTSTVDESAVLPLVLKEAWERSLAVFSSNVSHVRRGALFALYPDNLEIGRTLANAALRSLSGVRAAEGVFALREVRAAVNTRTAAHLGLAPDAVASRFDLQFPEP
ncbi:MAG TPA: ABC transporter substrate binding protein [Ideonella sp.]|nr:ABC transporter substrate binding protein [Ideonella sp.]